MASIHRYEVSCTWSGSTGLGYDHYDRAHDATATASGAVALRLSGDASFGGDPRLLNPEQLLVLAASSCQLLSFLAIAARARIDVVDYHDVAEGFMPEDEPPIRITRIDLRPRITLAAPVPEARVLRLVDLAHRECYIANSLRTDIVITPTIVSRS
ncbi:MAG TPA: OsmC family protein [Acidimicrobiales bacterium]|jgi:organic hydroperoxide reductase OsmC/OhrA